MGKHRIIDAEAEAVRREYEKATRENREERKRTRMAVRALRWVPDHSEPTGKSPTPPKAA